MRRLRAGLLSVVAVRGGDEPCPRDGEARSPPCAFAQRAGAEPPLKLLICPTSWLLCNMANELATPLNVRDPDVLARIGVDTQQVVGDAPLHERWANGTLLPPHPSGGCWLVLRHAPPCGLRAARQLPRR